MDPLALDQTSREQQHERRARRSGREAERVDSIGQDVDDGPRQVCQASARSAVLSASKREASCQIRREGDERSADRATTAAYCNPAHPSHATPRRMEIVAAAVADKSRWPAAPTVTEVIAPPADQLVDVAHCIPGPLQKLPGLPVLVESLLADRQLVDLDLRRKPDAFLRWSRAAGHEVDTDSTPTAEFTENRRTGDADPTAKRRVLVADHQDLH